MPRIPSGSPSHDWSTSALTSVNLNLLVPLLSLLEERSVTVAAEKIGTSQPAMSHALRKLRHVLDDELLVRTANGLALTPKAARILEPLKETLQQTARLVEAGEFDPMTTSRTITLAMTTSTAFVLGGRLSKILSEQAPHMSLKFKTGNMTGPTIFTDDGVDAVLLTETISSPYPRERLFDDRWIVIASPEIKAYTNVRNLIENVPHVIFEDPLRRLGAYAAIDDAGMHYSVAMRVTDYLLVPYLVNSSRTVAFHRWQVTQELSESLSLQSYEFPIPIQNIGVDLIWNPWLADDGFKAWLKEILISAAAPVNARYESPQ